MPADPLAFELSAVDRVAANAAAQTTVSAGFDELPTWAEWSK